MNEKKVKILLQYPRKIGMDDIVVTGMEAELKDKRSATERLMTYQEEEDTVRIVDEKITFKKAVKGLKGIAQSVIGFGLATEDEIEKRLTICSNCKFLRGKNCGECGCIIKHKTNLAREACPKGYWEAAPLRNEKEEQGT
jgi:hypothetical protein